MLLPKKVRLGKPVAVAHEKIFDFLLRVNEERNINATLRVAGGWVRDSLLGLHSQDIDIAIESATTRHVSGELFAREVASHQEALGMTARTVSVIRVNPELSKHIETATVCVYDTPIEFCALRHDEYTRSDSRIPVVRPATTVEDALRRDYTVNALFYNLHTKEVEDYTTGLEDLDRRILRCPLDPKETLTDDPLRLLRGVRFVGQLGELGFVLDESIFRCVDKELLKKVTLKVSRERVGKELVKMLSGPFAEKCIETLHELNLLREVILVELYLKSSKKGCITAEVERTEHLAYNGEAGSTGLECLLSLNRTLAPLFSRSGSKVQLSPDSPDKLIAMIFISCLGFYRGVSQSQIEDRLYALCVNGLKLPVSSYNTVRRMIECYNTLKREGLNVCEISDGEVTTAAKLAIFKGLNDLNDKKTIPSAFNIVFAAFILVEHRCDLLAGGDVEGSGCVVDRLLLALEQVPGLLDAFSRPLPLRGNELAKLVPLEPPQIGPALLALRQYLMLHPQASKDNMIHWLRQGGSS
ncbi:tRNA nucleotidyltransferase, putative [Trypanosoma brucei gambiense DAL972]|uniref:tRNA nucleotidyltransferase, putative n=1 Tax=Trypanosoma brucei gambiense (strain MHOM/CI/86/DAL972) TaxID=679716 RepID=C9ZYB2_TRYB9|nr:tRNA nucleotidyltransferase, putative [Trypanosoma brucei gambiense DAL972]CBH14411.1 tRNA nucleotidyltransferase, putative [Trypanosoma brucei gambiense DAL972]|eukprot:XP_011776677.1 tRNA nucleotidyltransferase, putative [Trypanosoma brucei gambiense DAL972]